MKKIITLLLTVALLTSALACGGGANEKTPGSQEKVTGSITEQEDKVSEVAQQPESTTEAEGQQDSASETVEQPEDTSGDISDDKTNVVVAPKSPDDPAPLVDRKV